MENKKYRLTILKAVRAYNASNPGNKMTIRILNSKLGLSIDGLANYKVNKRTSTILDLAFLDERPGHIRRNWEFCFVYESKWVENIEKVRQILGCEIWDLIEVIKN